MNRHLPPPSEDSSDESESDKPEVDGGDQAVLEDGETLEKDGAEKGDEYNSF